MTDERLERRLRDTFAAVMPLLDEAEGPTADTPVRLVRFAIASLAVAAALVAFVLVGRGDHSLVTRSPSTTAESPSSTSATIPTTLAPVSPPSTVPDAPIIDPDLVVTDLWLPEAIRASGPAFQIESLRFRLVGSCAKTNVSVRSGSFNPAQFIRTILFAERGVVATRGYHVYSSRDGDVGYESIDEPYRLCNNALGDATSDVGSNSGSPVNAALAEMSTILAELSTTMDTSDFTSRWRSCMSGLGYSFESHVEALRRFDVDSAPEPTADEVAVALADVDCQTSTGYRTVRIDALRNAVRTWLGDHADYVTAVHREDQALYDRLLELDQSGWPERTRNHRGL
jgi:hypothetical protein